MAFSFVFAMCNQEGRSQFLDEWTRHAPSLPDADDDALDSLGRWPILLTPSRLPNRCHLAPFQRLGTAKLRHGSRILCLAYDHDGNTLAAGGGNDPVRLWNPKTGELLRTINEPWVHTITFTPSGETLLYAGFHKTIRLWSIKQGKEFGKLEGHKATVKALAVSPDLSTVVSGSQDGALYAWDWNLKNKVGELMGHADEVTALAFCPTDSNLFASGGSDRTIFLWSLETKKSKLKLDGGCGVLALAFSPDGKTLYSAGDDALIRRWDPATGKQTGTFKGHGDIIVSLIAHGDRLISGALDRTIRIWDANTMKQLRSVSRSQGDCDALALASAGDQIATAGFHNAIRIFETAAGKERILTPGPQAPLAGLALSSDNNRLASVAADGQVLVWDQAGKLRKQWDNKQSGEFRLALGSGGETLVTTTNTVRVWNADLGTESVQLPINPGEPILASALSPDSKTLALGMRSAQIELWSLREKKLAHTFKYSGSLHALAWSPDGKKLAAAGGPKIFVWDSSSGNLLQSFDVKEGPPSAFPLISALAFGPDSKMLAAGGFDAMIRLYNLAAKNPGAEKDHRVCDGHQSAVYALAFSADGRSLVSGSFDKTARLWEAFSGKQIAVFKGHIGPVTGVAFAADGRSVLSAGADTVVYRWDVPGLSNNGKLPDLTLPVQELESAWTTLTTEETPRGHDVLWRAIASGKQAIPTDGEEAVSARTGARQEAVPRSRFGALSDAHGGHDRPRKLRPLDGRPL